MTGACVYTTHYWPPLTDAVFLVALGLHDRRRRSVRDQMPRPIATHPRRLVSPDARPLLFHPYGEYSATSRQQMMSTAGRAHPLDKLGG